MFLAGVAVLWNQGFRVYPFVIRGAAEEEIIIPETTGGISINDARKISTLKLDFTLFDDPIYKSLQLRGFTISGVNDIPHGRLNPFILQETGGSGSFGPGGSLK